MARKPISQQASGLESAIQAQADYIAELERKLEAYRDRAILQPAVAPYCSPSCAMNRTETLNCRASSTNRTTPSAKLRKAAKCASHSPCGTGYRTARRARAQRRIAKRDRSGEELHCRALESRLAAANDDIAEREHAAHGALDDTQPIESAGEMTAGSEFAAAGMFAPIADETAEGSAGGVPVRANMRRAASRTPPDHVPERQRCQGLLSRACYRQACWNAAPWFQTEPDECMVSQTQTAPKTATADNSDASQDCASRQGHLYRCVRCFSELPPRNPAWRPARSGGTRLWILSAARKAIRRDCWL